MSGCAYCRMRRDRGRLCVEHFYDFLGWLNAWPTGYAMESWFWLSADKGARVVLIELYWLGADPLSASRLYEARAA